jgi:hypothetical protein
MILAPALAALLAAGPADALPTPATPSERPVTFVLGMGYDAGSAKLLTVQFTDGSTEALYANQGFYFTAGLGLLRYPLGPVTIDTLTTLSVKGWEAGAKNGSISYLAIPMEVIERLALGRARCGVGLSYVPSPSFSSSGALASFGSVKLRNSLGLVFQGEWIGQRPGSGARGLYVGARFVWQKFEVTAGGGAIDANAFGAYLGFEL